MVLALESTVVDSEAFLATDVDGTNALLDGALIASTIGCSACFFASVCPGGFDFIIGDGNGVEEVIAALSP